MSMSTSVVGFVPPDEEWKKMKAVWDACANADVETPNDVDDFFSGKEPDKNGQGNAYTTMSARFREVQRRNRQHAGAWYRLGNRSRG